MNAVQEYSETNSICEVSESEESNEDSMIL